MAIWTYQESKDITLASSFGNAIDLKACPFCKSNLVFLDGGPSGLDHLPPANYSGGSLQACQHCGWWVGTSILGEYSCNENGCTNLRRICGELKPLSKNDLSIPIEELRKYLLAQYEARKIIHAKRFEEITGAVFSDFGYHVRVTSYSGDGGIDIVVLDGNDDAAVGIQVKRYSDKIKAEQIRSFVGALMFKGLTKGVFVTTSSFQRGALEAVETANTFGFDIQLVDSQKFYDALMITQRPVYTDANDSSSPFYGAWKKIGETRVIASSSW